MKRANAHFSDDLLAALLNEPLVGHGIFWSSAPGTDQHARPYPLSVRVSNFSKAHAIRDPKYDGSPLSDIYAAELRAKFVSALEKAVDALHIHSDVLVDLTGDANQQTQMRAHPMPSGLIDWLQLKDCVRTSLSGKRYDPKRVSVGVLYSGS